MDAASRMARPDSSATASRVSSGDRARLCTPDPSWGLAQAIPKKVIQPLNSDSRTLTVDGASSPMMPTCSYLAWTRLGEGSRLGAAVEGRSILLFRGFQAVLDEIVGRWEPGTR